MTVNLIAVRIRFYLLVAFGLTGGDLQVSAQHIHLAAGAPSQAQDSRLFFSNGTTYDINSTPPTPTCIFMADNDPMYDGLFQTDATFVVLPATLWTGGPAPNCPAQGSYIELRLVSLTGPAGGVMRVWEENEDQTATAELFNLPVGTSGSTNRYNISEGDVGEGVDTPDGRDPFGHIHGRRYTANKPGLYTLGVQLLDTSHNGVNGGPIHLPSYTNYFYFQAGFYIDSMTRSNNTVSVRFGTRPFNNYFLEFNTNLATTNWSSIQEVIGGNHSDLHYLTDSVAISPGRYYHLREVSQ